MLYDLASSPPEPGSLLESLFLLMTIRRKEAELAKTEAMIVASLVKDPSQIEHVEKSLRVYKNSVFPFIGVSKDKKKDDQKKTLEKWTKNTAFRVRPLWMDTKSSKRLHSRMRKGADRIKLSEQLRRERRHSKL